jgi:hypothetical protein
VVWCGEERRGGERASGELKEMLLNEPRFWSMLLELKLTARGILCRVLMGDGWGLAGEALTAG